MSAADLVKRIAVAVLISAAVAVAVAVAAPVRRERVQDFRPIPSRYEELLDLADMQIELISNTDLRRLGRAQHLIATAQLRAMVDLQDILQQRASGRE